MRSSTVSIPIFFIAASLLVSACEAPGISNLQVTDQSQYPRPTLQSKQGALQNTQSIIAERLLASAPDYYVPTIKAIGFSSIAIQPSKNLNQRRLMAIRAAKLDAYRVLAEQIHGVQLDGQTTVAEAMLTSDVLSSAVRGTIMGAETVKIEPTGSDTYIVELAVSQTHLERLIKLYKQGLL
ncbi:MAG: LPP20 family lipoprotein [Porticoccus sp.]